MKTIPCLTIALVGIVSVISNSCQQQTPQSQQQKESKAQVQDSGYRYTREVDLNRMTVKKHGIEKSWPIGYNAACGLITSLSTSSQYGIAESWLFESAHLKDLLDYAAAGSEIKGIRFYAAINGYIDGPGVHLPALTLIAVPIIKNASGAYEDYTGYRLYEFAQLCPPYCKSAYCSPGSMPPVINPITSGTIVPKGWYIAKTDLYPLLSLGKYVKFIRNINGNLLKLDIVGADKDSCHSELGTIISNVSDTCTTCKLCP